MYIQSRISVKCDDLYKSNEQCVIRVPYLLHLGASFTEDYISIRSQRLVPAVRVFAAGITLKWPQEPNPASSLDVSNYSRERAFILL